MAFLDFIKNRDGQRSTGEQQLQQQQTETAKQMYTRQAAEEQAGPKPSEAIRGQDQSRVAEAQTLFNKGTQEQATQTLSPTPAPEGGAANPQPMQQQGVAHDKSAPDMSPTSGLAASRAQDVDGPSAPAETPGKSQQQTVARPTPSWER